MSFIPWIEADEDAGLGRTSVRVLQGRLSVNCFLIVLICFALGDVILRAADPPPQKFVGPLSNLEYHYDKPGPIQAGAFTIYSDDTNDEIRVEGRDIKGGTWKVYVTMSSGLGYSVGWLADLDGDARQDLILHHVFPRNGRCTTGSRLTTILLDDDGRPAPWELEAYYLVDFSWDPPPHDGIMDWADHDGDGGVELIQRDCYSYSYQDLPFSVHGLVDVYEARRGYWQRLSVDERKDLETIYLEVAKREHHLRPRPEDHGTFIPDHSNDRTKGRTTTISKTIPLRENCGVVRLPPAESRNGQIFFLEPTEEWRRQERERCEDRFVLADGTDCFDKPAIVINRAGESIAVLDGRSKRAHELMDEIIEENLLATLTGQLREGLCSPATIWAQEQPNR